MKRYRIEPYGDPSHTDVNVQEHEDPKGEWVKWEDVKEQLLEKYLCGCSPSDDIEVRGKNQCACGFRR